MTKEEILNEFKEFLEEYKENNPLQSSGGTIAGLSRKRDELMSILPEINSLGVAKADELLAKANKEDKEKLKELLKSETNLFLKNYLGL